MKPLARRLIASFACASLLMAQWPASAWAAGQAEPNPAEAMKLFKDLGIYKDDADPLKTYLGDGKTLTPIGRIMFLSLRQRYNAAEEVEAMKPALDRLRGLGPYSEARQNGAARAMALFQEKFGALENATSGSMEEAFRTGAMREALMTGASIADPPKGNAYAQVEVDGGFEFWDKDGLAFRMTKNKVTTYNRELQKTQRVMNQNRPPQVEMIPETGRYNYQMLQYSYWRLRNQEIAYADAARIDRMIAIAELLGLQFPNDMWFNEKGLEADLLRRAKAKTYNHHGTVYSVFDIVDAKFVQRRAYLEGARTAVQRFETDMNQFKASNAITDSQVATMSLNEQNALRWLSLTVLETQMFHVRNQRERVDPTSPDATAIMKMVDQSSMTKDQKFDYKQQGQRMKERLDQLAAILAKTRGELNRADYAGSLDTVQAALASTQKELGDLSVDYSLYLEAPSMAWLSKQQAQSGDAGLNPFKHLYNGVSYAVRGGYGLTPWGREYKENMRVIEGRGGKPSMQAQFTDVARLIASGKREDWAEARRLVIAMNPGAIAYSGSASPTEDPAKINDAIKISSSLRAAHQRIDAVAETNKTLDAVSTFVTWTVSIALLAPVARATLNLIGKSSNLGISMMNAGQSMTGVRGFAVRATGRSFYVVGEIAKHTAARLESLQPDPGRVAEIAGNNWLKQYLVASAARAGSVAVRQGTFTAMSAGISGAFTVGTHLYDVATQGGVNVGGWQAIEPGHSMFTHDVAGAGKAFWTGAKGGFWWANESFHPALGYIGLPSTVFGGTRLAGAMDVIGSRGVVGSLSTGVRAMTNSPAAIEAAAASGRVGFLERLSEKAIIGKPAAFTLSMADNVAKYAIFSQVAGYLGTKWSWYVDTNVPLAMPFVGVVNNPEEDVERRIKRANQTGHAWLESPAWLLIPTHAAHGARDAGPYMQVREGMRQYDAITPEFPTGRTALYANAAEGSTLPLRPVKPPLAARLFEARVMGKRPATEWIVTKQAKEAGQLKEVSRLAKEGGEINPIELMAVREMSTSGEVKFRTLNVTEEVQKVAYEAATEGLVSQPKRSLEALTIEPGGTVKGWGKITPEMQIEMAKALYRAEHNLGKTLPKELTARVNELLKDHLQANLPIGAAGKALRAAVVALPVESPNLDIAQREAIEHVLAQESRIEKGQTTYVEVTNTLMEMAQTRLREGKLNQLEYNALKAQYDYMLTGHQRFNSFNKVEIVLKQTDVVLKSMRVEYENNPRMLDQFRALRDKLREWGKSREGQVADGAAIAKEARLETLITRLAEEQKAMLKQAEAAGKPFTPSQEAALTKALESIKSSPWVVRDAKGSAIPGWRPKQYVRLMQAFLGEGSLPSHVQSITGELFAGLREQAAGKPKSLALVDSMEAGAKQWVAEARKSGEAQPSLAPLIEKMHTSVKNAEGLSLAETALLQDFVGTMAKLEREGVHTGILSSGRKGRDVELFVKAPTSLGKTLLAYEGLLPYLEAEAAASGRKVMFLTFNTKLQAQAEFDFLAFNKLGSEVKFETYEGLKTMIAEGKTKGRSVAEDYLMLQDEMDAAGQQPALTIGMVSGRVSRLLSQAVEMDAISQGLLQSISRLNSVRVEGAEVQAQRIKNLTSNLSAEHVPAEKLAAMRSAAEEALGGIRELKRARGPEEIRLAEKTLGDAVAKIESLAATLPRAEAEAASTMLAAIKRMNEALDSRPSTSAEVRARLAAEMKDAFVNQSRLMLLTKTTEGLTRLPAEARKARLALEAKIERLEKELAAAEAGDSAAARRRASLIEEQIELARLEKKLVERFDGVDPSARLFALDEQIAAIRSNQAPGEKLEVNQKLSRLLRRSTELEGLLEPVAAKDAAGLKEYRAATGEAIRLERALAEANGQLGAAKARNLDVKPFEAQIKELNAKLETVNTGLRALETRLGGPETLPRLMRESLTIESRIESTGASGSPLGALRAETANGMRLDKQIVEAKAALDKASSRQEPTAELQTKLTELTASRETSRAEVRRLETELGAVKSTPRVDALIKEAQILESVMTPQRKAIHQDYRATLEKIHSLSSRMGEADAAARPALEAERATSRGRLRELELEAFSAPSERDLAGLTRKLEMLEAKSAGLQKLVERGGDASTLRDLQGQLKQVDKELAQTRRAATLEIQKRFNETGDQIASLVAEGKGGWDAGVARLLEARKNLQKSYAGDESALYKHYRDMKESVRDIGENPRLLNEPYKVPGGEGTEPAALLKRAEFLVNRAAEIEAKVKGGGMGPLEGQLMLAREKIKALQEKGTTPELFAAKENLKSLEEQLLRLDADREVASALRRIDGPSFVRFLPSLPKLLWETVTGRNPSTPIETMGLTRYHASKMLQALYKDPLLPPHQRDALMWSYIHSMFFPKGIGHTQRGSSYVRNEVINMVQGFQDNPAGVRVDNKTNKFNVVHNGQWFESMDNASRRWWELEYGTDLTLPYTHNSMSTIKDVTTNKKAYFISLSGTSGAKFEAHLRANKISLVGEGSAMPKNVGLEVLATPEARLARVAESLKTLRNLTLDHVVVKATDVVPPAARAEFEAFLATKGMRLNNPQVIKISEVPGEAARAWLQGIRATQKNTGLIVLSVSDTRALRAVERHLKKAGVQQDEIAKVFADTEFLRLNVPEANVGRQMNIEGLNTGKVKVLILDTRVGGRGLDLNFKGERNSTSPTAFRGYSNFEMLVLGPEEMSQVHMIQAMGRIDTGRTLSGAPRKFSLLLDVKTAKVETIFREMFQTDPFFAELRKDPAYQEFVRSRNLEIDWHGANEYILHRSNDGSGEGALLAQRAERAVRENLSKRNLEVEENLLRQSNVLTDAPTTPGKYPAFERIR